MDPAILALLIPLTALGIGLVAVVMKGMQRNAELRIRELEVRNGGTSEGDSQAIEEIRHELAEIQERLDFTERMLAQKKEGERLGKGGAA